MSQNVIQLADYRIARNIKRLQESTGLAWQSLPALLLYQAKIQIGQQCETGKDKRQA